MKPMPALESLRLRFEDVRGMNRIADYIIEDAFALIEQLTDRTKENPMETEQTQPAEPLMQFFEFGHLPEHLQVTSSFFFDAACKITATVPRNPERTVALRKLLEAKDCAVRAQLFK